MILVFVERVVSDGSLLSVKRLYNISQARSDLELDTILPCKTVHPFRGGSKPPAFSLLLDQ